MADTLSFGGNAAAGIAPTTYNVNSGSGANTGNGSDNLVGSQVYTPPNPSAPVSGNQVVNGGALNFSPAAPTNDGSSLVAGIVAGSNATQPPQGSDTAALDAATSGYNSANATYQADLANQPNASDMFAKAESANGVPQLSTDLQQINSQIAEKTAAYNQAYQNAETKGIQNGTPGVFYQGEQAAIQRQSAVELGNLGIIQAAKQKNFDLAEQRAKDTVDLQYKSAQDKITNDYNFLKLNQDNLTTAQQNAFKLKTDQAQAALDAQKAKTSSLQTLGIQAASGGAPQSLVQQALATNDPVQAAGILATYLKGPTESIAGNSEGTMFKIPTTKELGGAQFYKYPDSSQVYTSAGKTIDLATYKQLTGQTNVPDDQVKFSGIKTINGTTSSSTTSTKLPSVPARQTEVSNYLSTQAGKDGYVSPQAWKSAMDAWVKAGYGTATSFKTTFKNFINPADPKDYQ